MTRMTVQPKKTGARRVPRVAGRARLGTAVESPAGKEPSEPGIEHESAAVERDAVVTADDPVAVAETEETFPSKKRRVRWLGGAAAVVLAGTAAWGFVAAHEVRAAASENAALVDTATTSDVAKAVSDALGTVFSYRYDDPGHSQQAAEAVLSGAARGQYEKLFGEVRQLAVQQKLVVTSRAVASGVKLLDGEHAAVLVFLDQTGVRGDGSRSTGAAQLSVTAQRESGKWLVTGMSAV
ncbi:hypothetical protein [Amycolatopsis jiangsuensis]|uniref:Mce-associated membrane protein n=1 Tax=Amycolatopsis jiangsuensis TaxID=1181879 RepID=A0A840J4D1_9PSEU|nr:hypothetical protein [Amycolatopsis jiangsuensis]MBB4688713.1 Mce-associated membrane protein [Amycolatopsis jiangsuensis]